MSRWRERRRALGAAWRELEREYRIVNPAPDSVQIRNLVTGLLLLAVAIGETVALAAICPGH